ncbi:hypothetical protein [Gaoshiqia sp. Z1-71]|uniref:hypothetical protein n=1 Tax=Gaoshiqia hydrogeniformans TaxID=3290090 RepID=UPI003BF8861E
MRKKLKNQLPITGLLLIAFLVLTSHVPKDVTNDSNITNLLTIRSENGSEKTFDLLIMGKKENQEIFFKHEKSIKTPYELKIGKGTYSIIIHRTSKDGIVIGKIEMLVDGNSKASASSGEEITLLTIDEENNLGATGM